MTFENEKTIHIMICEKGSNIVNFNVPKKEILNVGDIINVNRGEFKRQIEISEIIESRQSFLKDFNYVRTLITNKF